MLCTVRCILVDIQQELSIRMHERFNETVKDLTKQLERVIFEIMQSNNEL